MSADVSPRSSQLLLERPYDAQTRVHSTRWNYCWSCTRVYPPLVAGQGGGRQDRDWTGSWIRNSHRSQCSARRSANRCRRFGLVHQTELRSMPLASDSQSAPGCSPATCSPSLQCRAPSLRLAEIPGESDAPLTRFCIGSDACRRGARPGERATAPSSA